ncbi:MAG: type II secretion system F family protein [Acidimicrobiia bacterium]
MTDLVIPAVLGSGCALGAVIGWAAFRMPHNAQPMRVTVSQVPVPTRPRLVAVGATIGVALASLVITGWIVGAVIAGLATWFLPQVLLGGGAAKDRIARTEAIAGWAEMIRDTLSGAAGLEEAIVATASVAPLPIRAEVQVLATRLRHERLGDALRDLADSLADPTADLVVSALTLAAERHARDLGGLLGSLAASARAQAAMQQRVEAGRARTRSAVRMVTVFTTVFVVGMVVLNRGYLAPFDGAFGQLVLATVGGGFAAAFVLLSRMSQVGTPTRVFIREVPS